MKKQTKTVYEKLTEFFIGAVLVLVALAVSSGMIQKILTIPGIPTILTQIAGWFVVLGVVLSLIGKMFSN
jgi:hypothetical protein